MERARGITGAIPRGSGIVAGIVAVTGTTIAGTGTGIGTIIADMPTDMSGSSMVKAGAMYTETPMPIADSVAGMPFAEARAMVVASTAVAVFTAGAGKQQLY